MRAAEKDFSAKRQRVIEKAGRRELSTKDHLRCHKNIDKKGRAASEMRRVLFSRQKVKIDGRIVFAGLGDGSMGLSV